MKKINKLSHIITSVAVCVAVVPMYLMAEALGFPSPSVDTYEGRNVLIGVAAAASLPLILLRGLVMMCLHEYNKEVLNLLTQAGVPDTVSTSRDTKNQADYKKEMEQLTQLVCDLLDPGTVLEKDALSKQLHKLHADKIKDPAEREQHVQKQLSKILSERIERRQALTGRKNGLEILADEFAEEKSTAKQDLISLMKTLHWEFQKYDADTDDMLDTFQTVHPEVCSRYYADSRHKYKDTLADQAILVIEVYNRCKDYLYRHKARAEKFGNLYEPRTIAGWPLTAVACLHWLQDNELRSSEQDLIRAMSAPGAPDRWTEHWKQHVELGQDIDVGVIATMLRELNESQTAKNIIRPDFSMSGPPPAPGNTNIGSTILEEISANMDIGRAKDEQDVKEQQEEDANQDAYHPDCIQHWPQSAKDLLQNLQNPAGTNGELIHGLFEFMGHKGATEAWNNAYDGTVQHIYNPQEHIRIAAHTICQSCADLGLVAPPSALDNFQKPTVRELIELLFATFPQFPFVAPHLADKHKNKLDTIKHHIDTFGPQVRKASREAGNRQKMPLWRFGAQKRQNPLRTLMKPGMTSQRIQKIKHTLLTLQRAGN